MKTRKAKEKKEPEISHGAMVMWVLWRSSQGEEKEAGVALRETQGRVVHSGWLAWDFHSDLGVVEACSDGWESGPSVWVGQGGVCPFLSVCEASCHLLHPPLPPCHHVVLPHLLCSLLALFSRSLNLTDHLSFFALPFISPSLPCTSSGHNLFLTFANTLSHK